jgi:polysaccharide pyruvyl transferase WcaK-like protein
MGTEKTMKFVLPRLVLGNRGDLASRWGLLRTLQQLGVRDVTVFRQFAGDVPSLGYSSLPYGRFFNLLPGRAGWRALRNADTVLWAVGLDLQDDSSLMKLFYLQVAFRLYRLLGLRIWCLFQGAGPLITPVGKAIAARVLEDVELFVARDPGTFRLIGELNSATERISGHDAIFLPGFEEEITSLDTDAKNQVKMLLGTRRPVIGLNLRQWFHFSSDLLPYEFSQKRYLERSLPRMNELLHAANELVRQLRDKQRARVILISAYQPGIVPWEDDLPWLRQVKAHFRNDPEVVLLDHLFTLPMYFGLMSQLDLMIGMRLHSSLIALRFGVPSINLSYTLKGRDIMTHLGMPENVIDLDDFIENSGVVYHRTVEILNNWAREREKAYCVVGKAINVNLQVLCSLMGVPTSHGNNNWNIRSAVTRVGKPVMN